MEAIVHTSARATIAIAASDARMRQGVFFWISSGNRGLQLTGLWSSVDRPYLAV